MRRSLSQRASRNFPPLRIAQAVSAGWTKDLARQYAWAAIAGPGGTVARHRLPCRSAWQTRPAETCPAPKMPSRTLDERNTSAAPRESLGSTERCGRLQWARKCACWRLLGLTAAVGRITNHRRERAI